MGQILITTLVITVISAVLAIILTIADRIMNDYGEVTITINDEKNLNVDGGSSLLSSLTSQKIFIPSACGGKGSCGYCKVKVLDGAGPVLATEKPWLSEEELANNTRLSCQIKVKQDLKIEIPEELFNVKEFETTLVEKEMVTDRIAKIRLELPEGEKVSFKPGQFMQIKTKPYKGGKDYEGSDESVIRAYSIASSIKDENHLEFLIGYTKGICTTYIHKVLEVGDKVEVTGPYGDFYYKDDDSDEILLIAAGTGFAPIRSILYHMRDNDIQKPARFYFGARTPDDLFLVDEMKMFEEELNDYKFMPTLSRADDYPDWAGDRGRVNKSIDKYVKEDVKYSAYLCGSPRMIEGIVKDLKDRAVGEDKIFFDEF